MHNNEYEKRCASPLSIGGDVKGKIAGKELATKEPQVDNAGKTVSLHLKKTKTPKKSPEMLKGAK